ncbi:hypothetical protein SAY87_002381 [Trapa incisa]|uniref:Uncharacterized protein n=1 Tax=Trapa incisa TaxID=236973 RepID=A0AAN7PU33_9MYRT|nr:hypothetical protein SAY87_002381 [Trapa incisa]
MFSSSAPSLGRQQSLALAAALFLSTAALLLTFPGRNRSTVPPSCLCRADSKKGKRKNDKRVRFADDVIDHWRMREDGEDVHRRGSKRRGRRKKMKRLDYSSRSPKVAKCLKGLPVIPSVQYVPIIVWEDVERG